MIIFESDGSKFKLRSVFDILAGNRNLFVNKMNEQIILIIRVIRSAFLREEIGKIIDRFAEIFEGDVDSEESSLDISDLEEKL